MKNTIENNTLLAEFLGWKKPIIGNGLSRGYDYELPSSIELYGENELYYCSDCGNDLHLLDGCYIGDLKFHTDWNWLMLVVDKIESLNLGTKTIETPYSEKDEFSNASVAFKIEYKDCFIDFYGDMKVYKEWVRITQCGSKIEAVYNACLEFVKWFNSQNK